LGIKEKRVLFLTLMVMALALQLPPFMQIAAAFFDGATSSDLVDTDFVNYWMGARLTLSGQHADLFRPETYADHLVAAFGPQQQDRAWSYPPHYLLLMLPLGVLPYETAAALFLATTLALFVAGALALRRSDAPETDVVLLVAAIAAYALVNVNSVQNGFLTGALLLFGLAFRGRRPLLAGIAFGLLTVKPQLGILIPLLLLAERDWATILWSAVVAVMTVVLSTALLGAKVWQAYLSETTADQHGVLTDWTGIFLYMMPTAFASARILGVDPGVVGWLQVVVSLTALVAALWLFLRDGSRIGRTFALLCATFLVSPYAFDYDMGALTVGAALLAAGGRGGILGSAVWAAAFLPPFALLAGLAGAPVAPPVLAVALLGRLPVLAAERRRMIV
jgi:hypothetical protein